jgi:hypothetical protein
VRALPVVRLGRARAGRIGGARIVAALAAAVALGCGCGGDDEPSAPDPAALTGTWDVSLVVGLVDADPAADPVFDNVTTYRETWEFERCDDSGCTLRRPHGGVVLGDLDDVRVELGDGTGLDADSALRLVGEGPAALPPPVEEEDAGPCDATPTQRWEVRVELGLRENVLSGSVFRTPEALRVEANGIPCFGYDLTLGLSGTPAG